MEDPIMLFSGSVFMALFAVLSFTFIVTIAGFFKKRRWSNGYEPKVSVVIPCYNEEKNIGACLEAVKNAGYSNEKMEIIVVDDGSSDRSIEIAKKFGGVRVLEQKHKGKVEALNLGSSRATGEIIITLDADVVIESSSIKNMVAPFSDPKIGAVSGVANVKNSGHNMLSAFQSIEYAYLSLIMDSFSTVFGTSFLFCGALAGFRKDVLASIGGFSKRTEAEDFDIIMQVKRAGYKTLSMKGAVGKTVVPSEIIPLFRQRARWWNGIIQSLRKNFDMLHPKYGIVMLLIFSIQLFWLVYSFIAIPMILYQIFYWIPYNSASLFDLSFYLFRWFNLIGIFYAMYMLPRWGVSFLSIFGILAGFITLFMILISFRVFKEKMGIRKYMGVFFFFPYTLLMNMMIISGAVAHVFKRGKGTFIK
jgi:cellulose synthase/poly-beta-1,6-N-acetylglucosamine synthase-like glycosyltransferase